MQLASVCVKGNARPICVFCGRFLSAINKHTCIAVLRERFYVRVKKTDGCWIWTGSKFRNGYGNFCMGKKMRHQLAHRYSYTIHNGQIPVGLCVLHRCDVRECVNPQHLFLGTQKDNSQDRISKCRPGGGKRKLNEAAVKEIYSMRGKKTQKEIGGMFHVSRATIYFIWSRKTWRHVNVPS